MKEVIARRRTGSWRGDLVEFSGILVDQFIDPVPQAEIRLIHSKLGWIGTVTTNSSGQFHREDTPVGKYDFQVVVPGLPRGAEFSSEVRASDDQEISYTDSVFTVPLPYGLFQRNVRICREDGESVPESPLCVFGYLRGDLSPRIVAKTMNGIMTGSTKEAFGTYDLYVNVDGVTYACETDHDSPASKVARFVAKDA